MKRDFEALEREIREAARRSIWAPSIGHGSETTWQGVPQFGSVGREINYALERAGFEPEPLPEHVDPAAA